MSFSNRSRSLIDAIQKASGQRAIVGIDSVPIGIPEGIAALNSFVSRFGLSGLPNWYPISRADAITTLAKALVEHLVYYPSMASPLMDRDAATDLAERFLGLFASDCECFTNGFYANRPRAYVRMSTSRNDSHLRDAGIVVRDAHRMGLLWVMDSD